MNNSISEITQLWNKALAIIEDRLGDQRAFDTFFSESYIESINANRIEVVVNSNLAATLMRKNYYEIVSDAITELTESNYEITFISREEVKNNSKPVETVKKPIYFQDATLNKNLTFDNFVVGNFNREAYQASVLIAQNPGKKFNPLFIHSHSGLGKTHLLHAIGNCVNNEGNPNAKILYITANDFVEEYIKYVRGDKDSESLKSFFKGVDILLLDDIQFLADKVKTEEMFFYIYSKMINDGKQVVITSDRQPNELKGLEERLVTRFSQGLVMEIKEPDVQTCVEILKKKIVANGLDLNIFDDSVIYFLADKFSKNVRELEGALNRLIFYVVSIKQVDKITLDVAVEAVQSLTGSKMVVTELNEQKIINVVADYYNLTPSQLVGKIRTGQIALARHIAMYLIRSTLDVPLKKIGTVFGGKDHTTVMNAISKVENMLKTDEQLKTALEELKKRLKV